MHDILIAYLFVGTVAFPAVVSFLSEREFAQEDPALALTLALARAKGLSRAARS
jgi:hypothetical protein